MSLDIHVMPLGKFWAGEYTTAAERLAERMGIPLSRVGNPKALYGREEARQLATGVRRWVEGQTGAVDAWEDEGEIVFSEQFQFEAIHAVRAYAAHQESSPEPFASPPTFTAARPCAASWRACPRGFPI